MATDERTRTKTAEAQPVDSGELGPPSVLWVHPAFGAHTRVIDSVQRVGRGDDCDTRLPGQTISWHHIELSLVGRVLVVADLGSRNGTRVNGSRIHDETMLHFGDVLRCGEWLGCVIPDELSQGIAPSFGEIAPGLLGGQRLAAAFGGARKLAPKGFPLAISGPTGAGKERAARALHGWSGRQGPFVAVNCAAVKAELAESLLFGHARGAFTGAERAHQGFVRRAHGGTLFLDEFATLEASVQAKLLRVFQEREVQPLGDVNCYGIDVLLLTATQCSLDKLVQRGELRQDLVARLAYWVVKLPALSARREDIAPLFLNFIAREVGAERPAPTVDSNLMEWLLLRPWSDNIRGLERLAKTMLGLFDTETTLTLAHVPDHERRPATDSTAGLDQDAQPTWPLILRTLRREAGNVSRTAEVLGLDRSKLRRILKEHPEFDPRQLRKELGRGRGASE